MLQHGHAVAARSDTAGVAQAYDTAHLEGGIAPTETIMFRLYGPSDTSCADGGLFTLKVSVNGGRR